MEERLFLPGSYRIGSGERCEIMLPDHHAVQIRRVHAVLEWSGIPNRPYLRPIIGDGSVKINEEPIRRAAELAPDDSFWVGPYELSLVL